MQYLCSTLSHFASFQREHDERDHRQGGEVSQHRLHPRRRRHLHQVVPPKTVDGQNFNSDSQTDL